MKIDSNICFIQNKEYNISSDIKDDDILYNTQKETNISYQYIDKRLKENNLPNECSTLIDFKKSLTMMDSIFDECFVDNIIKLEYELNKNVIHCTTIKYNPNLKPQYYTSSFVRNDGTLMFMGTAMEEAFTKIMNHETCYKPYIQMFEDEQNSYDIVYEVGDFIINTYYDKENAPKDKKWMSCVFQACLPINMSIKLKED